MPRRPRHITNLFEIDLHNLELQNGQTPAEAVEYKLDQFLTPLLLKKLIIVRIVVGKGLTSSRVINGKNPLRHYTENYLIKLGIAWTDASEINGGYGVVQCVW